MSRDRHPETLETLRRECPRTTEGVPDEMLARTYLAAQTSFRLYCRDLGHAVGTAIRRDVETLKRLARNPQR